MRKQRAYILALVLLFLLLISVTVLGILEQMAYF